MHKKVIIIGIFCVGMYIKRNEDLETVLITTTVQFLDVKRKLRQIPCQDAE